MKLSCLTISLVLILAKGVTAATLKKQKRKLTSKDVGSEHNRICLQVGERLKQKTPESKEDYIQYMREEMLTLCDEGDTTCHERVHNDIEESLKEDYLGRDYETLIEDVIEDVDDEELKDALRDIYHSIFMLEELSPDEVIMSINEIADEYENRADVDEWKKHVVLSSASVAASSTELWTSVLLDPKSGYYQEELSENVRRLQEETSNSPNELNIFSIVLFGGVKGVTGVVSTVISDTLGAIITGLSPVLVSSVTGADPTEAVAAAISGSVGRSISAFMTHFQFLQNFRDAGLVREGSLEDDELEGL